MCCGHFRQPSNILPDKANRSQVFLNVSGYAIWVQTDMPQCDISHFGLLFQAAFTGISKLRRRWRRLFVSILHVPNLLLRQAVARNPAW